MKDGKNSGMGRSNGGDLKRKIAEKDSRSKEVKRLGKLEMPK